MAKAILYLIISLLLIMCYIERQKCKTADPARHTVVTPGTYAGNKPGKAKPALQKRQPTMQQFTL